MTQGGPDAEGAQVDAIPAGVVAQARRISVVGTSGAGKSTAARRLASLLDVPYVELDALQWGPGWTEATLEDFQSRLRAAVEADAWVVDGNYVARARELVWGRAHLVLWIDPPLWRVMTQVVWRTVKRFVTREELWAGNRERLRETLSRDSVVWWALKTFRRRRRDYEQAMQDARWQHLLFARVRSRSQLEQLLATFAAQRAARPPDERPA